MAKARRKTGRRDLQGAFDDVVDQLPRDFASGLFKRKLTAAGVRPTRKLVAMLVDHTLAGGSEEFEWPGGQDIELEITAEDLADLDRATQSFLDEIPAIIEAASAKTTKATLKTMKENWPGQHAWETAEHTGFKARLEARWREPLNLLRMMLTMSRELGGEIYKRNKRSKAKRDRHKRYVLSQLHVRTCQVTAEILVLLENGYADGAMARWRTLYEIGVVATLIAEHNDRLAERYLAHEVVEARNSLMLYAKNHEELGYAPPSKAEIADIEELCEAAIARYGPEFERNYGWAAQHIAHKNPTFVELQAAAGRSKMRSHYKLASHNIHAGVKGITFKHGSLNNPRQLIAGASNAGLHEPGQNTAITLAQITTLLLMDRPQLDEVVAMRILMTLQAETVDAFIKVSGQLKREDKERRSSAGQSPRKRAARQSK